MELIDTFCHSSSQLPTDPSDTTHDPVHLERFVSACADMIALDEADPRQLGEWRRQAWTALGSVPSETLSAQNYSPTARQAPPVCLGTLAFLAIMRLTWLQARTTETTGLAIQDVEFCARHRLSCATATRPIITYSMSELVACIQALRNGFIRLPFHTDIVRLVDACEEACARMIFETGNGAVFDIPDASMRAERGANEYGASGDFLNMMWPSFVGFRRRLLVRCLLPVNIDGPPVDTEAAQRMCRWLQEKARQVIYQDASPSLKRYFVRMHLRPGDREISQLQRPGVTISDAGVVADTLAEARMAQINPRVNLTPGECIAQHTAQWSYEQLPEPLEFGICVYDFMDMVTQGAAGCEWANHYARLELAMNVDEVQRVTRDRPMVVQLFSHWQVVYANRVYWFNSVIASMTFWLMLMDGAQQGRWRSESPQYNAAARSNFYQEMVNTVVHNKPRQMEQPVPKPTASTVFMEP